MKLKKWFCLALTLLLAAALLPQPEAQAYASESATLTFSNDAITDTVHGLGYSISGTTLTISAAGTYRVTGQCAEGSIVVGKGLRDVTLILDDLELTSAVTAPIVVKKSSDVLLKLEGESTLTDDEDASTEDTNADFEGACIKVKSGSSLTVFGDGVLNLSGNAKNGLKGAATSSLTVDGGTICADAVNNAVAFDGSVTVNAGKLELTADGDGLKSEPDETDTASAGTVTIHGGEIRIRAMGDGIHAKTDLTITGGSFDIQTLDGYQSSSFNSDTMSCKGLKASDGTEEDSASRITISGGTFLLNTADDAVHSDGDISITFGTFEIYSGDDGVHAETTLTLGTEDGYERDPEITVRSSYEGLEGGKINGYSGKYYVVASDDGMNAAGGSSNGTDPFGPGGGWRPGGPGGGPGGGGSTGDYSISFYGGSWYVDCQGDGLDSNGALNMYGGDFTVLSMRANGDNSPLDADGGINIQGATVFGAGAAGMNERPSSASQKYYTDSTRRNAGTVVNVSYGGSVVRSEQLVRNISYLFYSSPDMTTTSCSVAAASEVSRHQSNAWAHDWDDGTVQTPATEEHPGVMLYTCSCGAQERKTVDQIFTPPAHTQEPEPGGCEHDYQTVVTEPTCTKPGFTTYTCAKCGDSYQADETAALGHDYKTVVTAPTCTETGFTTYTCAKCGDSYQADETAALGHDYKTVVTAPTCTKPGFTTYTCERCGDSYQADETAALGHDWDGGRVTTEPTETSPGVRTYTCNRCGETKTESIPELSHEHSYTAVVTAPTCTEKGYTTWTCACGDTYTDSETAALGHNFADGMCTRCGAKDPDYVPPVDKTELAEAIASAEAIDPEKYESVENLNKALEDAKAVQAKEDATQEEVDASVKALGDAIAALKEKEPEVPEVNKEALDKALEDAAEIDPEKYTEDTAKALADAVEAAKAVQAKEDATQDEVDAAAKAVNDAIATLVEKPVEEPFRFDDVKNEKSFYFKPVYWAYEAKPQITNGMTPTTFVPDGGCTRGQVVTFLWRAAGCPEPKSTDTPFTDVKAKAFYAKAVAWAVENGITKGMTDTTFEPDTTCTRGQIVTFLYRFKESPAPKSTETKFTDVNPKAFYAKAVAWAVEEGVTKGMTDTTFAPNDTCTRGQIVTFLYRAMGGK